MIVGKVACGLRLEDEGGSPPVLGYWRSRIRRSARPRPSLEVVCQVVEAAGVLAGRGRRVLDWTSLADAVATQDTVPQLVAAIGRVRRLLPAAGGVELAAHDDDRAAKPDGVRGRTRRPPGRWCRGCRRCAGGAVVVGEVGLDDAQAEAVALLALVAGQAVEPERAARLLADRRQGRQRPGDLHRGSPGAPCHKTSAHRA